MTRAVLFDAGHTLLEADYATLVEQVRACGHDADVAAVTQAERRARCRLDREQASASSRARTGEGRYLRYLLEGLGIVDGAEVAAIAAWRRGFNLPVGLCHRADPGAVDALRRLREGGVVTGVISNSNGSVRAALERAGLVAYLDFVIDSTVVGIAKPDARVFELGLASAAVAASEACYVGDSYFVDVCGARAVGMRAVLFDPGGVWAQPDCLTARTLPAAAELALAA